ncbi:bifunctional DNA-formamidopyrimidine glycosylase/DNA-(apurinic or apyrimidinic site) lyase [Psychrobium sp. 1_MG-2023]|uniref:bifunctional DNA-formamidopyrimidine glycosylase/DNA-(apurinic or apyrimidinic site) lyase n=1 Tax=Psychrobium sp. 1_MG-2023 TaxID=3062624 RepID=UPI000C341896|nr:bifunctional DNA-formamidopyrimidine glycosylase/DNA-(apurinic or apyrimidinic site) lyase [Psychrobium sp. 1_MG-2023]MDP2562540.1 bifunctional DNA-formamidopyrimidine glycosylase/DNA-(apurinic or apyrimidinic site) lyase [Psychrobium sp. 1_MG-2023]PKF57969.1 DNA-formamidopyrimidine glycosylase [Alteromonadales bacterium alter-6D02]
MPELPEVEVSRMGVSEHLTGKTITDIVVRTPKLRWDIPQQQLQSLIGQTILRISRRAKYLVIETAIGHIIIHLGMSGSLRVIAASTALKKHDHVDVCIGDKVLRLNDPRRFGAVLFSEPDTEHSVFAKLGPEPLTDAFNSEHLMVMCNKRKAAIKQVIMDNPVVVGVGNIYANESLFLTGIHPQTPANQVPVEKLMALVVVIKQVLAAAIKQGGTTLKDFSQTDGKPGYFAQSLYVYGRGGEKCLRCETVLEEVKLGQRASVFCPVCQPKQ